MEDTEPVILGAADGLVIALGLLVGLVVSGHAGAAVWHSAVAAGSAELVGMSAAVLLSDGAARLRRALACGAASLAACVVPAVPYAVGGGVGALVAALALVLAVGAVVAWLRPQHGLLAVAQTFGVLLAAAVLTGGTALL